MQNPFSHGNFRDRSRPFIVVVIILLGLLFVAAFFVKPVWRATKDRRALKFVAAANAAMAADDATLAAGHLRAAHALSPWNPEVLRATGTHFTRLSRPEGLIYWQQLDSAGHMTDEDRFAFAQLALENGDLESARSAIIPLGKSRPEDPDALRLLAWLYFSAGQPKTASATLQDALDAAPFREDLQILWSRIELTQTNLTRHPRAKTSLLQIIAGSSRHRGEAALALLETARLDPSDLRLLGSLLKPASAGPSPDLELARFIVQLRLNPARLAETVAEFQRTTALDFHGAALSVALTRLIALKEFGAVARLVSEEVAEKHRHLYPFRLEALAGLRAGPELMLMLKEFKDHMPKGQIALYEAMAASFNRETNQLALRWQQAVTENRASLPILKIVAERAEQEGVRTAAIEAWRALLLQPTWSVSAAWSLIRLTAESADPRPALEAYRQLAELNPGDPEIAAELNFYRALLDVEADQARDYSAKHPAGNELNLLIGALLALGKGDPEQAFQGLEASGINWAKARRTWRVVWASALTRTGQYARAREVVRSVNLTDVCPREAELLGDLNKKTDQ